MWMYMLVLVLVVAGLVGGAFLGGIFTIVLIPIAVIVFVASAAYRAMGAAGQRREGGDAPGPAYPHSVPDQPGHVPTSPEALTDARRAQQ